ncbi:MAG: TolC family protein, partial [Chitinophagia bacterium]|nr:TolC family protein [Chitinophagia bacterium]
KTVLKLNDYNLKRYQYAALPTLVAFGALGSNLGSNKFSTLSKFKNYESNSLVGLTLSVPVFSGFQRMYQVKEAKLNIEKTKNNIANLQQGLDFQAVQARTSLKNAFLLLQSLKKNTDLANDIYDLARKKYKEGVGSNLEVTQAQTEQLKNQNSYFATLLDIINAEADLKKALGQF